MLPTWPLWVCYITHKIHKLSCKDSTHDHQKCSQASPIFCSSVCIQFAFSIIITQKWKSGPSSASMYYAECKLGMRLHDHLEFTYRHRWIYNFNSTTIKSGYRYLFSKLTSSPLARFSPIFIVHDSIIPTLYGKFANFELWMSNKSDFHHGTCQKSI